MRLARRRATVVAELRPGVRQPRRRADQRVRRHAAREPAADRRGRRPDERAAAVHAAGQPLRHVGFRGGAAGDVGVGDAGSERGARPLRRRLDRGLRQIAFFVVPSAMAFLALGDVIAAALLQTGRFSHADAVYVWGILAGSAVGLLASTLGRLYSSTYYALRDTRTPLRYALVRVVLTTVPGYLFAIPLPRLARRVPRWGAAGSDGIGGIAGWVEMLLLRGGLNRRIGRTGLPVELQSRSSGVRRLLEPRRAGQSSSGSPRGTRSSRRPLCSAPSARRFVGIDPDASRPRSLCRTRACARR